MVQYDRMVLNHLLDTYENSLLSIGENRRKVQIEFRFTRTSIPAGAWTMLSFCGGVHKDKDRKNKYREAQIIAAEVTFDQILIIADAEDSMEDIVVGRYGSILGGRNWKYWTETGLVRRSRSTRTS